MTMVDVDELTPGMLRGYYCGWIKRNEFLPEDKKRDFILLVQRHFTLINQSITLVELVWRRQLELEKEMEK